jgi:chitodextrinase
VYDTVGLDHPTWVGGAIAGQSSTYRGTAPSSSLVSSSTGGQAASLARDQDVIAATDWAIGSGGADIVNTSLGQDTSTGREQARKYFDSIVAEDGRVSVSSAGNYSTFSSWNVVSPGTGWNVLTVGGTDDGNTGSWSNDTIWSTSTDGSCYVDPAGTAWNPHGDFNKPNVSAPAVTVQTANGQSASGTSISAPIVAGVAAELVARNGTFVNWPEIPRALIMAGAIHHTLMPNGTQNAAHEGVGTVDAEWSNRILNGSTYGGFTYGALSAAGTTATFPVAAGQHVRIALVWDSHTSGSNLSKTDTLTADLDLRATFPDGATRSSLTFDNNYEFIEYTPTAGGTATIHVGATRFDATSEDFALAWVKWPTATGDTQAPTAPTNLVANPVSSSSIALSWTGSTDNVAVAGYRVSRNGTLVGSPTGTSWTDTGLTANTSYDYSVVAFDAAGNVSPPATASATTPPGAADGQPPSAPTNLKATVNPSGMTKLSWGASTDNVGVAGYRVYRNGGLFATVTGTSYSAKNQAGTYSYYVVAFDAAGNVSGPSNTVTATVT